MDRIERRKEEEERTNPIDLERDGKIDRKEKSREEENDLSFY